MKTILIAALPILALAFPALGASSDWIETEGGRVRIVAAAPDADGTIPAILEVRLAPGWKTYWRDPGGSGIPPHVTLDPKGGLTLQAIDFPAPERFGEGVARAVGYHGPVSFPLRIASSDTGTAELKASVFLGICKDICIPVQGNLSVSIPVSGSDAPLDRARIDAARAALPEAPSDTFRVTDAHFDLSGKSIALSILLPDGSDAGPVDLFVAGASGYAFGEPEVMRRHGQRLETVIPVRRMPKDTQRLPSGSMILTVQAGARAMETTLAFD